MSDSLDPVIEQAKDILRGASATPEETWSVAKKLKAKKHFGYARRLLARARSDTRIDADPGLRTKLRQQHALCTYKDPELAADVRFDRAIEILGQCDDLAGTGDQETLGIAGAIYKNKWEAFAQKQDLERSLNYYFRGYEVGPEKDYGYTGINAAYVLDLLAHQEPVSSGAATAGLKTAELRRAQAREIREKLVTVLTDLAKKPVNPPDMPLDQQWWFLVTLAEAHFGLGQYAEASRFLERAAAIRGTEEWEFETTARQMAALAGLRDSCSPTAPSDPTAMHVIQQFLGDRADGAAAAFRGKVGLALSGGGFRASLFHIGVLARLAELDYLRHVEFLSCVSGGSILGAHYYLEVRRLLQSKADGDVTRQDYIDIVRNLERDFLAGVQRNVRMRVLANWPANVRMIFQSNYSRTERIGGLYESEIYALIADKGKDGKQERLLNHMFIAPPGEPKFNPKNDNWRRRAKIPILILNATTLNTGHNWQFTASWMGEPPAGISSEIDANDRYRRMYYGEAPERYRNYKLGNAVGSSACVPGLFEPINMPDLFPDRVVRLVDGGVNDNQGVSALLEQGCTTLLVSDASGQMEHQNQPGNGPISAVMRSFSISQTRVRESEYHELDARRRSGLLRGLMFVHLKKDLDVDPVDWIACEDPVDASDESRPSSRRGELTCYGIRRDVQRLLAAIRTDLDSFHDAEAYALMTSGYRMTEYEFPRTLRSDSPDNGREPWQFLRVEKFMKRVGGVDKAHRELMDLLRVGNSLAFKIWTLSRPLRWLKNIIFVVLGLAAIAGFIVTLWKWSDVELIRVGTLGALIFSLALTTMASAIFGPTLVRIVDYRATLKRIVVGLAMASIGCAVAWIHLVIFDRLYLKRGRLERLLRMAPKDDSATPAESVKAVSA